MPETLEPQTNWSHRMVVILLTMAVLFSSGMAIYSLIFGRPDAPSISASQLRAVLNDFREKRRERMLDELSDIQKLHAQLAAIRDRRLQQVNALHLAEDELDGQEAAFRLTARAERLSELPMDELFEVAVAIEQDANTLYREFLAALTMASRRELPYDMAFEQAAIPRVLRRGLIHRDLYPVITSAADQEAIERFKTQITRSVVGMREINQKLEELLAFTAKSDKDEDRGITARIDHDDLWALGYRGEELLPDELDFTLSPDLGDFRAIPGRRLVEGGMADEWMYIDTWYIIGPFESDRRRTTLDTRFGPEFRINLDEVMTGLDDRELTWDFKKVGWAGSGGSRTAFWKIEPRDVVSYGIYYAFTEIYSDAPRSVWIATATDDYGKLWINDRLEWVSATHRKPYNATENLQRIQLQQGQNKVLFRVENAGGTMGFSLLMRDARVIPQ